MAMPSTVLVVLMSSMVGLSVGLPAVLDRALIFLAEADLELKGFYRALESHQFAKAGEFYDKLVKQEAVLRSEAAKVSALKAVQVFLPTDRFIRLAEVQMKVLLEKLGAIINTEPAANKPNKPPSNPKKHGVTEKPKGALHTDEWRN